MEPSGDLDKKYRTAKNQVSWQLPAQIFIDQLEQVVSDAEENFGFTVVDVNKYRMKEFPSSTTLLEKERTYRKPSALRSVGAVL